MVWEVEQKFPLVDAAAVHSQLIELGVEFESAERQVDAYFQHPARDFRQTDEAFRLRRCGSRNFVTYKGPKVDRTTKTRQEIELPLPAGEATSDQFHALFVALGFRAAGTVTKSRQSGTLQWAGHAVHVALDEVEQLGTFLELEIVADDAGVPSAQAALQSLSEQLGLRASERRSYLELLQQDQECD